MKTEDKVELLVKNFKRKHGTNPTCVFLPAAKETKFLGLVVKQGDKLSVGVGNRILFWNTENVPAPESKSVFKLIEEYDRREVRLTEVLNAIVDYEQERRKELTYESKDEPYLI